MSTSTNTLNNTHTTDAHGFVVHLNRRNTAGTSPSNTVNPL